MQELILRKSKWQHSSTSEMDTAVDNICTCSSLLRLPGEIRNQIWKLTFDYQCPASHLKTLSTCKQIYHEAGDLAFHRALFNVPYKEGSNMFSRTKNFSIDFQVFSGLSAHKRALINHVKLWPRDMGFANQERSWELLEDLRRQGVEPVNLYARFHGRSPSDLRLLIIKAMGRVLNPCVHQPHRPQRIIIETEFSEGTALRQEALNDFQLRYDRIRALVEEDRSRNAQTDEVCIVLNFRFRMEWKQLCL